MGLLSVEPLQGMNKFIYVKHLGQGLAHKYQVFIVMRFFAPDL